MNSITNLESHFCLTTTNEISKLARPLFDAFGITHFRYLKLFPDGKRTLLSNHADCIRFFYGQGHYKQMWFDGEFPHLLKGGWHIWDTMRAITENNEITPLEKEINYALNLYHGMTFVSKARDYHEIYTFDSNLATIYQLEKSFFLRFISFFKEQAHTIIENSDQDPLVVPSLITHQEMDNMNIESNELIDYFLQKTKVNRFYLTGKYSNVYLTEKELRCVYWLINGKSAEEIAIIESNTKKTIQYHFENIRNKLDCYKQTQIIPIVLESGVLNALQ